MGLIRTNETIPATFKEFTYKHPSHHKSGSQSKLGGLNMCEKCGGKIIDIADLSDRALPVCENCGVVE